MNESIILTDVYGFWWNKKTNTFYSGGDIEYAVHLNSAKLNIDDTLALKSENEELRSKIAELENIINNSLSNNNNKSYDISCLFSKILLYSSLNRKIAYNDDDIILYTNHYQSYEIPYKTFEDRFTMKYDESLKSLVIKMFTIIRELTNMKICYLGKPSSETQYKHHLIEWHISLKTDDLSDIDLNKRFVKHDFNDVESYKDDALSIIPGATLQLTIQTDFIPATINGEVDYNFCTFYQLPSDFDVDFN